MLLFCSFYVKTVRRKLLRYKIKVLKLIYLLHSLAKSRQTSDFLYQMVWDEYIVTAVVWSLSEKYPW